MSSFNKRLAVSVIALALVAIFLAAGAVAIVIGAQRGAMASVVQQGGAQATSAAQSQGPMTGMTSMGGGGSAPLTRFTRWHKRVRFRGSRTRPKA